MRALAFAAVLMVGGPLAHAQDRPTPSAETPSAETRSAETPSAETPSAEAEPVEAAAPETPTCAEGREATELSQGRCCWPGQTWSDRYGRCSGPPACPGSLVAEGDDCVAPVAPAPRPMVSASPQAGPSPERPPVSWASFEGERPRGGMTPRLSRAADEGWMIFGGLALGAGWAFSIVVGSIGGLASDTCSDLGGYAFIPLFGGLVHAATLDGCAEPTADAGPFWGPYITASVAQLAGLVAFVVAVIAEDAEALELDSLTFSVPGADVGVGYRARF